MAKFETIVRPVIFPNIRPTQTRTILPEEDPTEGFAVIHGSSGGWIDLPFSWSQNMSQQRQTEIKRKVDEVRVYQKDDDGTVNQDNFVDIQVAKKIWLKESGAGNSSVDLQIPINYKPVKEEDNIEILRKDVIIKNPGVQVT